MVFGVVVSTYTARNVKRNKLSVLLYINQKQTLEAFLERGAISKAQFDKSLGDLTVKMGMSLTGEYKQGPARNGTRRSIFLALILLVICEGK